MFVTKESNTDLYNTLSNYQRVELNSLNLSCLANISCTV